MTAPDTSVRTRQDADTDHQNPSVGRSSLRAALLRTILFFDLFDYPLTLAEVIRFRAGRTDLSPDPPSVADAITVLGSDRIGTRDGYYFLRGRDEIVEKRKRRYRISEKKYARAKRMARFFRHLPSVRLIAVCNSLALSNADNESDIDIFVICRHGHLWITRLLIVGTLKVLGLRPTPESHADKLCLSFFVSERRMDISRASLRPRDTYLNHWIVSLIPVYDAGGVMEAFFRANSWVRESLPGALPARSDHAPRQVPRGRSRTSLFLPLLGLLERPARAFQMRRFPRHLSEAMNRDTRVMVDEDMLKFHINDRRGHFEDEFRKREESFGLSA